MKNQAKLREIIERIPKTDLHLHLDGSLRLETIIDISKKENLELPSYTVAGLNETVFKDNYKNLEEYLMCFGYSGAVMQKPEYLEQISYELAKDNQAEGVLYIEVRFAPQLHVNQYMTMEDVLMAVNKGLETAKKEFNEKPEVANGSEPEFHYGIIACAMRNFGPWSEYYSKFIESLSFSDSKEICGLASLEMAKAAVKIRDEKGIPIVGFDLAGAEAGYPASEHKRGYQYAHEAFMNKTVHAGEAYGPESIFQAITDLHADRIGHGYHLFNPECIKDPRITDKDEYVKQLIDYIAERRITIEVCLTSNMQTMPEIKELKDHNFGKMLQNKLSTTFCTDNRTVSKTTVTDEIMKAVSAFDLTDTELRNNIVYGFKRSFYPGVYSEKRKYVRSIINHYERVTAELFN